MMRDKFTIVQEASGRLALGMYGNALCRLASAFS